VFQTRACKGKGTYLSKPHSHLTHRQTFSGSISPDDVAQVLSCSLNCNHAMLARWQPLPQHFRATIRPPPPPSTPRRRLSVLTASALPNPGPSIHDRSPRGLSLGFAGPATFSSLSHGRLGNSHDHLTLSRRFGWATATTLLTLSLSQGRLGNCYYLAAISSCADGNDDVLLKDLIIEDGIAQAREGWNDIAQRVGRGVRRQEAGR
jgi:hypothetical protein